MKARAKLLLSLSLVVTFFCLMFVFYGYDNTWKLWNIPTMTPHFADLRVITAGAESYAEGYDPMVNNPADPWNRKLSYPRIWQCLYSAGINQGHTTYLGIGLIFLFLVGVSLPFPRISNISLVSILAVVLSPAVLLGIERANNDLLIFFLLALAVVSVNRRHILSASLILFSFILKFYPLFGLLILLRKKRGIFIVSSVVCTVVAVFYIFFTFEDILKISDPRSPLISYGLNVFWLNVMENNPDAGIYAKILSYLVALLAILYAFTALRRHDLPPAEQELPYLDSFRMGSAIYSGTFLLFNNFDYRFMFLIFTIPQLLLWVQCSIRDISMISKITLLGIYISIWYSMITPITEYIPHGFYVSLLLDETSNWVVFAGLLYLLFLSMPDWVKQCSAKLSNLAGYSSKTCHTGK